MIGNWPHFNKVGSLILAKCALDEFVDKDLLPQGKEIVLHSYYVSYRIMIKV